MQVYKGFYAVIECIIKGLSYLTLNAFMQILSSNLLKFKKVCPSCGHRILKNNLLNISVIHYKTSLLFHSVNLFYHLHVNSFHE
jgi:hypothetical protein